MAWRWGQLKTERMTLRETADKPKGDEWRPLPRGSLPDAIGYQTYERLRPPAERKGYCGEAGKPEFGE
jgi:hypothetical protein